MPCAGDSSTSDNSWRGFAPPGSRSALKWSWTDIADNHIKFGNKLYIETIAFAAAFKASL